MGKLFFNDGTLGTWEKAEEAFQKELNDACTEYNDLELMHAIGSPESIRRIDAMDAWGFMRSLKASGRVKHIESFIAEVESLPDCISEFRTDYWGHLVEKVTVHRKGAMTFTLSCGVEIEI